MCLFKCFTCIKRALSKFPFFYLFYNSSFKKMFKITYMSLKTLIISLAL